MKPLIILLVLLQLSACANIDWRYVRRNWAVSACRSNSHCTVECDSTALISDPNSPLSDPHCDAVRAKPKAFKRPSESQPVY